MIAGQSNALGISPVKGLLNKEFYFDSLIYQASNVRVPQERRIVPVSLGLGADKQKFGLEIGAALALSGERCGFIKYASDGTSLYDRWSLGGEDFNGLKETFFSAMDAFSKKGHKPRLRGILWMQGENDASSAEQAAVYCPKLKQFIAAVRSYAGEVPFVIGETNPQNPCLPFADQVNAAKKIAAEEMENVYFVPTGDLTELIDHYHYSADNMLRIGERMAKIFKEKKL